MLVSAHQSFSCPWPVTSLETTHLQSPHQRRNLALERIPGFHALWSVAIGFIEKSSIYYQGTQDKSRFNYRMSCLDWVAVAMGAFSLFNRIALPGNQNLCHWLISMVFMFIGWINNCFQDNCQKCSSSGLWPWPVVYLFLCVWSRAVTITIFFLFFNHPFTWGHHHSRLTSFCKI